MSEVNIPLLRKAVEWVEEQDRLPEQQRQWNQWNFVELESDRIDGGCGTAYCVAGYIGALVDARFTNTSLIETEDGAMHVADVAEDALGLPDRHGLFQCNNTAADIRRIAEGIAGERL